MDQPSDLARPEAPRSPWDPPPQDVVHQPAGSPYPDQLGEEDGTVYRTRVERFHRTPVYLRAWVMLLIVTALAGGLRFWHLSDPRAVVFDETYYARDGCFDSGIRWQACGMKATGEQTVTVHPPLGRELIALSERLFTRPGDFRCKNNGTPSSTCDPFGWRFGSAVAGTLSVLLLAILAWKLFESVVWGYAAGILLATESLNLVQSRISMLDIYVTVFVVAGFLFVLLDRRWIDRRTPKPIDRSNTEILLDIPPEPVPSPVVRPWRIAAGVAFGAAAATKWSGLTALIGGIVLVFAWECTRRRRAGLDRPVWATFKWEAFGIFVFMVLVPAAVYFVTYTRWFVLNHWDLGAWLHLQRNMADFSLGLRSPHPYASAAWKWILMWRPVAYYFRCPVKVAGNCTTAQAIVGMGNPFLFWVSVIALPYAAVAWIRKRDWRAGLVVVAAGVQYFPWFLAKRTSFLFYMAPITPFLALAVVYGLRDLSAVRVGPDLRERTLAPVAFGIVFTSVAVFAFFFPVLTAMVTSWGAWHVRMWFPSWV